ncbi:MAG: hypothetical protein AB7G93_22040 [Bdellovibrionales bacterium]
MAIVTKQMVEESKAIVVNVIDKDLYENAKALVEIHKQCTGTKPVTKAGDLVRQWTQIESTN